MQCFLFAWVNWLMLEAMLLPAAVFPLTCARPLLSPRLGLSFAQSYANSNESLFEQTSSFLEEFSLQDASESRPVLTLPYRVAVLSKKQERDGRLRPVPVPTCFPLRVLFPRKLSPPSAEDDPFLS